jgi:hypothetical protein
MSSRLPANTFPHHSLHITFLIPFFAILHIEKKGENLATSVVITLIQLLQKLLASGTLGNALAAVLKKALILLGA